MSSGVSGRVPGLGPGLGCRRGSPQGSLLGSPASRGSPRTHSPRGSSRSSQCSSSPPDRAVLLRNCLAVTLRRTCYVPCGEPCAQPCGEPCAQPCGELEPCAQPRTALPDNDFWMYDNGYLLFRGLVEANARCFWSAALLEAMRELRFVGYVSPGVLLVRAGACALDVVRAAWARRVLKPPPNYIIARVGDIEDCAVVGVPQSQFTPLPEALCWVILELTSAGQAAVLPAILRALPRAFPCITSPSAPVVYDALAKLTVDRKVYQTARGYFLVTPETRRRLEARDARDARDPGRSRRSVLLSNDEALILLHGDMRTERDGHRTHQCVQTNLADVICGGNADDKILYARPWPSASASAAPRARSLERRHSLRLGLLGQARQALQRAGSLRSLPPRLPRPPSPSPGQGPGPSPDKKLSLLSRLFRRSGRPRESRGSARRGQSAPPHQEPHQGLHQEPHQEGPVIKTFSAQFPQHPADWFNPTVRPLASVATQTLHGYSPRSEGNGAADQAPARSEGDATHATRLFQWDSGRASTLPRSTRGSPRRPRRLSDSLSVSLSTSPSLSASLSPSKQTSSRTHLSSSSSRASRASSGYNSAGTRSGSPSRKALSPPSVSVPQSTCSSPQLQLPPTGAKCNTTSSTTTTTTTTTTTNINGTNTKIFVQQHNSPVRSFITIENRRSSPTVPATASTATATRPPAARPLPRAPLLETSFGCPSTPSLPDVPATIESDVVTTVVPATPPVDSAEKYLNNRSHNKQTSGSEESLTSAGSLVNVKEAAEVKSIPALSTAAPVGYKNILASPYASLSDLSVHCKSLAAQRILSGVSINSIDTLVEVNMAAAEKKSNCDVTIRTDFGMV